MRLKNKEFIIFLLILFLAFFLRFFNLSWDSNFHLHPDERFLTMVMGAMRFPLTIKEYLDPTISKLNPVNIGYQFFVYGTFPLILVKSLAVIFNFDNYNQITILGRFISGLFDLMIVILIYKTVSLLLKINYEFFKSCHSREGGNPDLKSKRFLIKSGMTLIPLFSVFFYAISVYPIQSSHFFTVDTFLNFFMFGSFYFTLKFFNSKNVPRLACRQAGSTFYVILSGIFFGLALACKISALYILPLNFGVIILEFFSKILKQVRYDKNKIIRFFLHVLRYTFYVLCYTFFVYLSLRLFNPYYFASSNFFDFHLNQSFVSSIQSLKSFNNKEAWYPPGVQWINKPWWGLLSTTFFSGLGPVNFIVMVVGIIYLIKQFFLIFWFFYCHSREGGNPDNKRIPAFAGMTIFLIIFWTVGYFVYQSSQFVKSIRYTIYLYPFYAVFGGVGIAVVRNQLNRLNRLKSVESVKSVGISWNWLKSVKIRNVFLYVLRSAFYVLLFVWPMLFFTIYFHKNTRVGASEWIYKNLPNNAVIVGEHWDDPLPLYVENPYFKSFQVELLPIFDPDTGEKWEKMKELLSKADYYVLSSNRGWGSIPTAPERYPIMSDFYKKLFNEECFDIKINCKFENCHPELACPANSRVSGSQFCFKKIKEFLPYYYKFIRYPDSWIEETFTVYDHQMVLIYEKVRKN